jgi:hypothetical protein
LVLQNLKVRAAGFVIAARVVPRCRLAAGVEWVWLSLKTCANKHEASSKMFLTRYPHYFLGIFKAANQSANNWQPARGQSVSWKTLALDTRKHAGNVEI